MILDDLKLVEAAEVRKAGVRAASLVRDGGDVVFEYEASYSGAPIAFGLPRDAGPVRRAAGSLPPFFSGLLPEGRRLSAIQRATKTSLDDELTLLLAVGEDTVGDVQVMSAGKGEVAGAVEIGTVETGALKTGAGGDVTDFAQVDFHEVFERAVGPGAPDRAALAGVQDKISGRMMSLPLAYAGAAWILKLDPPEYPELVANEAFFLAAARASGIEVTDAEVVVDRNGAKGLLVRRFDRVAEGSGLRSLAQEDACQALGRYPADKYRLTTEEVVLGLARCTGAPIVAAHSLLRQFAFAYLSCNGDAHGKNFSVLQSDEWRVAPAYDLPCSQLYGDNTMALTIGGKDREDIGRKDFIELGLKCGVPSKATERVIDSLLKVAPAWIDRLEELPFDTRKVHKLRKACRYRAERLREG